MLWQLTWQPDQHRALQGLHAIAHHLDCLQTRASLVLQRSCNTVDQRSNARVYDSRHPATPPANMIEVRSDDVGVMCDSFNMMFGWP